MVKGWGGIRGGSRIESRQKKKEKERKRKKKHSPIKKKNTPEGASENEGQ